MELFSGEKLGSMWGLDKFVLFATLSEDTLMGWIMLFHQKLCRKLTPVTVSREWEKEDNQMMSTSAFFRIHPVINKWIFLQILNSFISRPEAHSPNPFQGVHMNDIPVVEDLLTLKILFCDEDITDRNFMGKLARRSIRDTTSVYAT